MAKQEKAKERRKKRTSKRRELGFGPDRTTVRAQLDHLWSLAIRRRDRKVYAGLCLVCVIKRLLGFKTDSANPIEVAYHVLPRGNDTTRWLLENGVGACGPCNEGEKWSRSGGRAVVKKRYRQIHIELIGEKKLLELEALAEQTADFSTADLIELRDKLKALVEGRS